MNIFTLKKLQLSESWTGVKLTDIAIRQGSLDGACGAYALMTMLMIQSGLSLKKVEALWGHGIDGRSLFGRWLKEHYALLGDGTCIDDLSALLEATKKSKLKSKASNLNFSSVLDNSKKKHYSNKRVLSHIADTLKDQDKPVLLRLNWDKQSAHWVVAVGYQISRAKNYDEPPIASILTIDSSSTISRVAAWNGILSEGTYHSKKLEYLTHSEPAVTGCIVSDAYILSSNAYILS